MFRQKKWFFKGRSGTEYVFEIYSKSSGHPTNGGIYMLTYTHPRGHLAGFEVQILSIGESDNLRKAVTDHPRRECLRKECWNCIYLLEMEDSDKRKAVLNDLIAGNETLC